MDDVRFGMIVRGARMRRGRRQRDIARYVGVSDGTISRIERGHLDRVSLGTLRRVARGLEIQVELLPRSRSANADRLLNAKHAELAEAVIKWMTRFGGWIVRPEVSFSRYGERGVIDLLAWHPGRRVLLIVELKTAIVDVGELLGTLDRKVRNALEVARSLGWDPISVSAALIVAEGATNRRRIAAHAETFRASLPGRTIDLRRWLSHPVGEVRALAFFSVRHHGQVIQQLAHRERVTVARERRGQHPHPIAERERGGGELDPHVPRVLTGRFRPRASSNRPGMSK